MAEIKSGAGTDKLTIDSVSKAARVTSYDLGGGTDQIAKSGAYFFTSGALLIQASADAATAGRIWLINPIGSGITTRIRQIIFRSQLGSVLVTPTSPRITAELVTFTGTPSGAAIISAKRKSTDPTALTSLRTASTGLSLVAGSVITEFLPIASYTAVGAMAVNDSRFDSPASPIQYIDLMPGEGIVIRQADAGTTSDTRRYIVNFTVEEY